MAQVVKQMMMVKRVKEVSLVLRIRNLDHLDLRGLVNIIWVQRRRVFKGEYHYYTKPSHKISDYLKHKDKCKREGISLEFAPLVLVLF